MSKYNISHAVIDLQKFILEMKHLKQGFSFQLFNWTQKN